MMTRLSEMLRYLSEAFMSIFRPADVYPEVGVQPFEGEPYSKVVDPKFES